MYILYILYIYCIYWGRIRYIEFERHGLPLPIYCMGMPFKVSTHYLIFFCKG